MSTHRTATTSSPDAARMLSKPKHTRSGQSLPNIGLIICLVAYLSIAFLFLSSGFAKLSYDTEPRLDRAQRELQVYSNTLYQERLLYAELDELLDSQLTRVTFESYEQCLGRGLVVAERKVFEIGLQYPDIRNQVISWTEDNCGRFFHSPSSIGSNKALLVIMWFAENAHRRSQRILEVVTGSITQGTKWICSKSVGHLSARVARICREDQTAEKAFENLLLQPSMPFGFDLNCTASPPCRLTFPQATALSFDKTAALPDTLNLLQRKVANIGTMKAILLSASIMSAHATCFWYVVLVTFVLIRTVDLLPVSKLQSIFRFDEEELLLWLKLQHKMNSIVFWALFLAGAPAFMLPRGEVSETGYDTLGLGLPLCLTGFAMLIVFFLPPYQQSHQLRFTCLSKELQCVVQAVKLVWDNRKNETKTEEESVESVDSGNVVEEQLSLSTPSTMSDTSHDPIGDVAQFTREIPKYQATAADSEENADTATNAANLAVIDTASTGNPVPADWTMVDV